MNWNEVLWAAIGGAAGGVLGALASKRIANKTLKTAVLVVPLILCSRLLPRAMAETPILPANKLERAGQKTIDIVRKSPAFMKLVEGKSNAEISALTQQKSHAGLRRLSEQDLITWNRIRLVMAEGNPTLCAALWSGQGLTPQVLSEAMNKLDQSNLDSFATVSARAAVAEVENQPFVDPTADAMVSGVAKIKAGLSPDDVARLDRVLAEGDKAPPEEGCWAMKVLMRESAKLSPDERERFLRFLTTA